MRKLYYLLLFQLIIFFQILPGFSQVKTYETKKIIDKPPVIDGIINEPCWDQVSWEGSFTQQEPNDGQNPTYPTDFKILYDNDNLYVAIRCYDPEPGTISRRLARRDVSDGDKAGIYIDSYFDHRTAFGFVVNAAGVKIDFITTNEDQVDDTWDPIWMVKTRIDNPGWYAEMRIPFSQLRFGKATEQVWGIQVVRRLFKNQELSSWVHIPRQQSGFVSQFGELRGIRDIRPHKEIELLPYVMAKADRYEREEGNPFKTGKNDQTTIGLDGKIAVTNDLTLNFTVNPDFGQVEADPSEVNLSAYETYFQEKRPFFVEGKNIYDFKLTMGDGNLSNDNLFYSRRIGRTPHYEPGLQDNEYADIPTETSILGAFKLSGKTRKGLSIGVMEIMTSPEKASIEYSGQRHKETVEPFTNYYITRLQQDFNKGNTIIGGMATSTNRQILDKQLEFLPVAAYTGGADITHYWKKKDYYWSFKGIFSNIQGSREAITGLQQSSVHYFQRPDAGHLTLDTNRKALTGTGGTFELGKMGGGHFQYLTWLSWRSPGLELNDMGYLREADEIQQIIWIGYRIFKRNKAFQYFNINLNQYTGWDFGGLRKYSGGNINFSGQFLNYWSPGMGINRDGESFSLTDLRGGPAIHYPGGWSQWYSLESDTRKKFSGSAQFSMYEGDLNYYHSIDYSVELTFRPTHAMSIRITPSYSISANDLQYVTTASADQKDHFIVSYFKSTTLSTTIRFDVSLTPDLSIQYYGQPFLFTGQYKDFKRIISPRAVKPKDQVHLFTPGEITRSVVENTYEVDENGDGLPDYSFDDPDFSFFQFRSNLVIRWEFFPGSTLFLVWSQGRTGSEVTGDMKFRRGINDLMDIHPQNIFLVKVSYRIHS
ncbi:MAG: DUF5916 domain-containing protein [Bacteroidetes bacterium]|nr:DUF5916 domain-containing protein [Bacteroidota bacterium]